MTLIAAQQPYFLPNFYFFTKIFQSDTFLLADHLKYRKQSPISRVTISPKATPKYLSIPINHTSEPHPPLPQVEINNEERWKQKHLRTLQSLFSKYPYFDYYFPILKEIYQRDHYYLYEFLKDVIFLQMDFLSAEKEIEISTQSGISDLQSLKRWMDSFREPILLIHPEEQGYYQKNFPEFRLKIVKKPGDIFHVNYTPNFPLLNLLFLKGPETTFYLKKEQD